MNIAKKAALVGMMSVVAVSAVAPVASAATKPAPVKTISKKVVAQHASASSCWTIVKGGVYDVTSWISAHPGGKAAIEGMCGKDATRAFSGQHGMSGGEAKMLASFKIGKLGR